MFINNSNPNFNGFHPIAIPIHSQPQSPAPAPLAAITQVPPPSFFPPTWRPFHRPTPSWRIGQNGLPRTGAALFRFLESEDTIANSRADSSVAVQSIISANSRSGYAIDYSTLFWYRQCLGSFDSWILLLLLLLLLLLRLLLLPLLLLTPLNLLRIVIDIQSRRYRQLNLSGRGRPINRSNQILTCEFRRKEKKHEIRSILNIR